MKLNPMETNYPLMNMKAIIYFNYSPFIHKSSIFYTYIRIHKDYKSLQQGSGEMELFLNYWEIIHGISCPFNLIDLWTFIEDNLHQNTKYWSKKSSLKEMNSQPSVPHSIELKYGEKTSKLQEEDAI